MKKLSEYRDPAVVKDLLRQIEAAATRPWVLMEVCGGQTHAIMRHGLHQLLPARIELVHGPGCPVCVTPVEMIDKALAIAARPEVIFTSFGDMLRVPGTAGDLFGVRAAGGDVRVVYSPLDAVEIARQNPDRQIVFLAIGFETTAPANAMSVLQASELGLDNFSLLVSHVRVPPALRAILDDPGNRVNAFLAAGHVCAVMGFWEYPEIASQYGVPIVVTGFEPIDLARGILLAVQMLEGGVNEVGNAYSRVVSLHGNVPAQGVIDQVFAPCDRAWRGIGVLPGSGWTLRPEFADFDAQKRFRVSHVGAAEPEVCIAGQVLRGLVKPDECPAFARECTPSTPLGATMVSDEGACAAYYRYARDRLAGLELVDG